MNGYNLPFGFNARETSVIFMEKPRKMKTVEKIIVMLVMFWNLENFFYPSTEKSIGENLKTMTWKRFGIKRDIVSKTVMAVKDRHGAYPSVIGLCEVENIRTLKNLLYETPLFRVGYKIIHKDSPDSRGIDVALLYKEEDVVILDTAFLRIHSSRTRDILYAKMRFIHTEDTIHVFVNHWPSKLGGAKASAGRRMEASALLFSAVDSVLNGEPDAKIVAMGDFNDSPSSPPISGLVNLSAILEDSLRKNRMEITGTHKYRGGWEMLDQFIASAFLKTDMHILQFPHLMQPDKKFLGKKTRRTFTGPRFDGGASDHLPILLEIYLNSEAKSR